MEYKVLAFTEIPLLEKAVNEHLAEGWRLQGGVSCSLSESDDYHYTLFVQAVVRGLQTGCNDEGEVYYGPIQD